MPSKTDKKDHVVEIAEQTWQLMTATAIPPSPENFLVWYTYFDGFNLDINKEIDRRLATNEEFTPEVNTFLHTLAHQGETDPALLTEVHAATGEIITGILEGITSTNTSNQDYQKDLNNFGQDLKNVKDRRGMWNVINRLIGGSQKMESSSSILQDLLNRATEDITQLETRLEEAENAANTDGLTGINNRHAFENKMSEVCLDLKPDNPLSLLMVDIDHFKHFNDTYGHQVGDVVLRIVAQIFAPTLPPNAFPARYGGEEFVIILPGLDLAAAIPVADKLRDVIARRELRRGSDGVRLGKITISLGVSVARAGDDPEMIVERADKALYKAKENGRNRVESEVTAG